MHVGDGAAPKTLVQLSPSGREPDDEMPSTYFMEEQDGQLPQPESKPEEKKVPFLIGSHFVLNEKFFAKHENGASHLQYSKTVQFVPAFDGIGRAFFMDFTGRSLDIIKKSESSISLVLPDPLREEQLITKKHTTLRENGSSWDIRIFRANEFIRIPDEYVTIISFDQNTVCFAVLIRREKQDRQPQHWIVAFPCSGVDQNNQ